MMESEIKICSFLALIATIELSMNPTCCINYVTGTFKFVLMFLLDIHFAHIQYDKMFPQVFLFLPSNETKTYKDSSL